MSRLARHALVTLLGCGMLAGCATTAAQRDPRLIDGPLYRPDAIYRLSFQGMHLGMEQRDACERLIAMGYRRDGQEGCAPPTDPEGDSFRGTERAFAMTGPVERPGDTVISFGLAYHTVNGRLVVTNMDIYTNGREAEGTGIPETIREWGQPTLHAPYSERYHILYYASSRRQADPENRERFGRCRYLPQCAFREGIDCGAVFARYSAVVAKVSTMAWGRNIQIDDFRPELRARRASGEMRRRPWESSGYACPMALGPERPTVPEARAA
jgi:hypothetical protein